MPKIPIAAVTDYQKCSGLEHHTFTVSLFYGKCVSSAGFLSPGLTGQNRRVSQPEFLLLQAHSGLGEFSVPRGCEATAPGSLLASPLLEAVHILRLVTFLRLQGQQQLTILSDRLASFQKSLCET